MPTIAAELTELRDEYLETAKRATALVDTIAYMSVRIALSRVSNIVGDEN